MRPASLVHEVEAQGRTWHVVAFLIPHEPELEPFYFWPALNPTARRAGLGLYGRAGESPWRYVSRRDARRAAGRMLKSFHGWPFAHFKQPCSTESSRKGTNPK